MNRFTRVLCAYILYTLRLNAHVPYSTVHIKHTHHVVLENP